MTGFWSQIVGSLTKQWGPERLVSKPHPKFQTQRGGFSSKACALKDIPKHLDAKNKPLAFASPSWTNHYILYILYFWDCMRVCCMIRAQKTQRVVGKRLDRSSVFSVFTLLARHMRLLSPHCTSFCWLLLFALLSDLRHIVACGLGLSFI